jgi:hypothetical protein
MRRIGLVALLLTFALSPAAMAESACHSLAIGKNGKPLAGAALNSFMTKCTREACEPKAISKDGKALAGAAKTSFMKKCQSEA